MKELPEQDIRTVYVYKYAATQGVFSHTGVFKEHEDKKFADGSVKCGYGLYWVGRDCCFDEVEAHAKGAEIVARKLKSIEKQRKKLEARLRELKGSL